MALETHQAFVARLDVVAEPDAPDAARADVHVVEAQLVRHVLRPSRRLVEREVEDSVLNVGSDTIRVRVARAALLLDERGDAADLEGALHLVERIAVVAHQLAGLRDVAELLSELQQGQLPSGTVAGGGHSVLQGFGLWRFQNTLRTGWPPLRFVGDLSDNYSTTSRRRLLR